MSAPEPEKLRRMAEEWRGVECKHHPEDPQVRWSEDCVVCLVNLLERVVRETAAAVLTAYPCTCSPDDSERAKTAPECFLRRVTLDAGEERALRHWNLAPSPESKP